MKRFLKMLIVSFICFLTCNLQAQIKSNEAKPNTENMPDSPIKVGKIPTNMQKMDNSKCSRNPVCSNSRETASKENTATKNSNTRKEQATYEANSESNTANNDDTANANETILEDNELPDSFLEDIIGIENIEVIKHAHTVILYDLESPRKERGENTFQDFLVIEEKAVTPENTKIITSLLLDQNTYTSGDFVKQCLFLPNMGVEFVSDKGRAKMLVSLLCDVVHFYQDDESYNAANSDNGHSAMQDFYRNIFPKASISLQKMDLPSPQPIYYTTKEGDNLFQIAQQMSEQYNQEITTDLLLEWNNYTDADKLAIGHQLIVGFKGDDCK